MAILSGDSNVGITISSKANTKGIDDTADSLNGLSAKTVALGATIGALAATGITKLASGLVKIGTTAIDSASDFEQSRIAFDTMLGNADKARKMMKDISDFAKATPFELPELVKSSKQLLAFGIAQDDIIPTMRKLGDIAAGVGVPVGQLAYVFGQVRVAGKLMGGDLMQFTNAGVPMIEGLSKVLKVSQADVKKMVEEGKVGFKEVQQVLDDMTGSGSKFGGMMDKQSQSFGGVVSNIKDGFGQMLRAAVGMSNTGDIVKGGFFDKIKDAAFGLMNMMNKIDFSALSQTMASMMDAGTKLGAKFINGFKASIEKFVGIFETMKQKVQNGDYEGLGRFIAENIIKAVKTIVDHAAELGKSFMDMIGKVDWMGVGIFFGSKVIPSLVIGLVAGFASIDIGAIFNQVMSHWGEVLIAVLSIVFMPAKLAAGIGGILLKIPFAGKLLEWGFMAIRDGGGAIIGKLWEWLSLFGRSFVDALGLQGPRIIPAIVNFIMNIPRVIGSLISTVDNKIGEMMISMGNSIAGWGPAQVVRGLQHVKNTIFNFFAGAGSWLYGIGQQIVQGIINGIGSIAGNIGSRISGLAKDIGGSIKNVLHNMKIPGFATGVRNFSGGLAVVGENGPELVNLPRGSNVYTNGESKKMMGQTTNNKEVNIANVYITSADAAREFFKQLDNDTTNASRSVAPLRGEI